MRVQTEYPLERIYNSVLKFLQPLDLTTTYQTIVDEAIKLVNGTTGSIFLQKDGKLERVYSNSQTFYQIKPRMDGYTYGVFKTRQPLILNYQEISKIHPEIKNTGTKSDIIVSLTNRTNSIGILTIQSGQKNSFNKKDLQVLTLFSALASLALRKTILFDEVSQALETRDMFISMAAHELRTPLTTINGYIHLLWGKLHLKDSPEGRWINELSWESERLTQLVKELLEINRIKAGQLDYRFKECKLSEIVTRALTSFKFSYPGRKIILKNVIKNDLVIGDFDKLLQVFNNVLDNAAKYSPAKSPVTVTLKENHFCLITQIQDQGVGINKEELPKIFENYYRGSNHQREGLGTGLYLAKNIIDRHRGNIIVKSGKKGTNLQIVLPKVKHD